MDSIDANAKPYIHEAIMETWRATGESISMGLVRRSGTSNVSQAKMELPLRDCKVKPCVNEMEIHPHYQQPELYDYTRKKTISK